MTGLKLRTRKLDIRHGLIDLAHGAGGRASVQLIDEIFRTAFDNPILDQGNDQAAFRIRFANHILQ